MFNKKKEQITFMITAKVKYNSNDCFLDSFLYWDESIHNYIWSEEKAQLFYFYEGATKIMDDIINKKKQVRGSYYEVKDIRLFKMNFDAKEFDIS